jgi:hypothetical protein
MPIDVNWTTVLLAVLSSVGGSLVTAAVFTFRLGKVYGEAQATLATLKERLEANNGTLKAHELTDAEVGKTLAAIDNQCKNCRQRLDRNDREHDEIFGRIRTLETSVAGLPGEIARQMDERFKDWRKTMRGDVDLIVRDYWNLYRKQSREAGVWGDD